MKELKIWQIQKWFLKSKDIKYRDDFKSEEEYLMYLATNPLIGTHTKKLATKRLHNEYPNGLFALCKTQNKTKYTIEYKYKDMMELPAFKGDYDKYIQRFRAIVSFKVYDEKGNKVISDNKCRVICGFDNRSHRAGEINLFEGLTYDDLSQEVREQILLDKLKEIIQIRLKLNGQKWSDLNETVIEIVDE